MDICGVAAAAGAAAVAPALLFFALFIHFF